MLLVKQSMVSLKRSKRLIQPKRRTHTKGENYLLISTNYVCQFLLIFPLPQSTYIMHPLIVYREIIQ